METVYTDKPIDSERVQDNLARLFPGLRIFHYDFSADAPEVFNADNPDHVCFNASFYPEKPEFGFYISLFRTPTKNEQERQLYIGRKFSELFGIRVLVPFTKPDEPQDPYYDIIFEAGKSYLADDSDTSFADDSDGLVRIIGVYVLPEYSFDPKANLIVNEQAFS